MPAFFTWLFLQPLFCGGSGGIASPQASSIPSFKAITTYILKDSIYNATAPCPQKCEHFRGPRVRIPRFISPRKKTPRRSLFSWRKRWDSNPRYVAVYLISSKCGSGSVRPSSSLFCRFLTPFFLCFRKFRGSWIGSG